MLTNNTVTLFGFSQESGEYQCLGSFPAWVHKQDRTRREVGGTYDRDVFDVRIPISTKLSISSDDIICFRKTRTLPPDFDDCNRIAAITYNNVGHCPHLHIRAEHLYR